MSPRSRPIRRSALTSSFQGTRVTLEEAKVGEFFSRKKFWVLKSGWPDFLIVNDDGQGAAIEVKKGKDQVTRRQDNMHCALKRCGLSVFVLRDPSYETLQETWQEIVGQKIVGQ